ncbi:hypothetical protein CHS0354_029577 [Potamilus streckersoni]|uniref:C-type lectin domain-containing protein n=1 Tax=Potamilus streckersoni TaxID=2493646 RepID=A0AAE0VTS8_9BIVA|nr:hypothetical protein CHS0354_029577 [Potamilus streckersoni]
MCPMNKSEAALNGFKNSTNTKIEILVRSVSRISDVIASIRRVVGHSKCRSGYEYYQQDKFCYKFHSECKSWSEARQVCREEGGDLISLKEANLDYFRSVARLESGPCSGVWVGSTDITLEGIWKWLNGETINRIFWYPEQPDNWQGEEHCGQMMKVFNYLMNDEYCNEALHFICQIV